MTLCHIHSYLVLTLLHLPSLIFLNFLSNVNCYITIILWCYPNEASISPKLVSVMSSSNYPLDAWLEQFSRIMQTAKWPYFQPLCLHWFYAKSFFSITLTRDTRLRGKILFIIATKGGLISLKKSCQTPRSWYWDRDVRKFM